LLTPSSPCRLLATSHAPQPPSAHNAFTIVVVLRVWLLISGLATTLAMFCACDDACTIYFHGSQVPRFILTSSSTLLHHRNGPRLFFYLPRPCVLTCNFARHAYLCPRQPLSCPLSSSSTSSSPIALLHYHSFSSNTQLRPKLLQHSFFHHSSPHLHDTFSPAHLAFLAPQLFLVS
jgi:hypothetical protein